MPRRKPRMTDLTPAEWVVMRTVWESVEEDPDVTATELLPAVEEELDWHFSTLKTTMDRLVIRLRFYRVGDSVKVGILRGGEMLMLEVELLERPEGV